MRITGSIILGVIGAILYFAVTADVAGLSLSTVGVILMLAAAVWFILELVQASTGRRTSTTQVVRHADGSVEQHETDTRENREL